MVFSRPLPPQQDVYEAVNPSLAGKLMAILQETSLLFAELDTECNPTSARCVCVAGLQSTGKSITIEYLIRVSGVVYTRSQTGTKRPIVYQVTSNKADDGPAEQEIRFEIKTHEDGAFRHVDHETFRRELIEANSGDFTEDPFFVKITAASAFDIVLVDLPGIRSPEYRDYCKIQKINQSFLSRPDSLIVYIRTACDWETDGDPGMDLVAEVDPRFHRTVLVTNRSIPYLKGMEHDHLNGAREFFTAQRHRFSGRALQHVPKFFIDFILAEDHNSGRQMKPTPVDFTGDVSKHLENCEDWHEQTLGDRFPSLVVEFRKVLGTKRLGDYVRKVILDNFHASAQEIKTALTKAQRIVQAEMKQCQAIVPVNHARERYMECLQASLREVVEHAHLPRDTNGLLIHPSSLELSKWAAPTPRGDHLAGSALWLRFVTKIIPRAVHSLKLHELDGDELNNLVSVACGKTAGDAMMTALYVNKSKGVGRFEALQETMIGDAATILHNIFQAAKAIVIENVKKNARLDPKWGHEKFLWPEPRFTGLIDQYLDDSFEEFIDAAKARARSSFQEALSMLSTPPAGIIRDTILAEQQASPGDPTNFGATPPLTPDQSTQGGTDSTDEDDGEENSKVGRVASITTSHNALPNELSARYIAQFQAWATVPFIERAVDCLVRNMLDPLINPLEKTGFALCLPRPGPSSSNLCCEQLCNLQDEMDRESSDKLSDLKTKLVRVNEARTKLGTITMPRQSV